jgi:Methane oxygenase PmoA
LKLTPYATRNIRLTHDPGRAIEIAPAPEAPPVQRYVYPGAPKPYFHPLLGPAGVPLTIYEPYDHLWHRGLWFTIKLRMLLPATSSLESLAGPFSGNKQGGDGTIPRL